MGNPRITYTRKNVRPTSKQLELLDEATDKTGKPKKGKSYTRRKSNLKVKTKPKASTPKPKASSPRIPKPLTKLKKQSKLKLPSYQQSS